MALIIALPAGLSIFTHPEWFARSGFLPENLMALRSSQASGKSRCIPPSESHCVSHTTRCFCHEIGLS